MFSYGKSGPLSIHGFLVLGLVPKHATILLVQPMCSGIYHMQFRGVYEIHSK